MRHRPTPVIVASILAGATTLMVPVGASAAASGNVRVAAFSAAPSVTIGTRVGVSGRVAPARSVRVLIQRHRDDGTWTLAGTVRSAADGRFSGMVPLAAGTSLRAAVVRGDGGLRTSSRRYVRVSRLLELSVSAPPYEDIVGRPFRVKGVVRPGGPGDAVTVEGSRGRRFIDLGTVRVSSRGRFSGRIEVPADGTWRFRVRVGRTDAGQTGAQAHTPPLVVHGRNPHAVPRSAPHYLVQARSETRLYYYQRGRLVRVFPVVFGAPGTPTPIGRFRVYSKTAGPSPAFGPLVLWYHRGYGIHGTNQEYLLGRSWRYYSHGCTRNYNDNIRWLWPRVPVGTPVVNLA